MLKDLAHTMMPFIKNPVAQKLRTRNFRPKVIQSKKLYNRKMLKDYNKTMRYR